MLPSIVSICIKVIELISIDGAAVAPAAVARCSNDAASATPRDDGGR